jgi:hypothetical protein
VHQYKEQQENLGIVEFKARGEIITSVALEPNIVFIEPIFKILHFLRSKYFCPEAQLQGKRDYNQELSVYDY